MSLSQKILLVIHASYGLANVMAGLFLNLYLWRLANDLSINASFMLVSFIFTTFAFWVGGKIAKQKDRVLCYQLGLVLTALFYLKVVILQESVATIPMVLGVFNGFAVGLYWLGFFVLLYDLVDIESRSAFLGKQMAVFGVVHTLGPIIAGLIISIFDIVGYTIVFIICFFLYFISVLISLRLPKDKLEKGEFKLKLLWSLNRKYPSLKTMWTGWVIWGTCEGIIIFFPPILLFMMVNDELIVGGVAIFLGAIAITSSLWHSRYNHKEREPYTVLYIWVAYLLACLPLLFVINLWTVFLYLIINEISKALIGVSYFSYMLRKVGNLPKKTGLRIESMVMREIAINSGRVISVLSFIILYIYFPNAIYIFLCLTILIQGFLFKIMIKEKSLSFSEKKETS